MGERIKVTAASPQSADNRRFDLFALLSRIGVKTLRAKLFLLILLLTGFSVALTCTVAYLGFHRAIESSADLRRSAATTAETINFIIYENLQFVRSVAADDVLVNGAEQGALEAERLGITALPDATQIKDLEARFNQTRALRRDPAIDNFLQDKKGHKGIFDRMLVTDKYGLNIGMTTLSEDFVQSDELWWQETMKKGYYIEDVRFDKPTESFSVELCLAIPARRGGYGGVLKAKYNLHDAQDYLARFKQHQTGYAYVVNHSGQVVLHPDPDARNMVLGEALRRLGYADAQNIEARLKELTASEQGGQGGTITGTGINRNSRQAETRILTFEPSRGYAGGNLNFQGFDWVFVTDNSEDEVHAPAYSMLSTIVLTGIGSSLLLGVVAFLFAGSVSKRIRRFLDTTEEVSAGNLDARVRMSTGDELEKVARGFNNMMDRLSATMKTEAEQRRALREGEERYRTVIEQMSDCYWETDLAGRFTFVNNQVLVDMRRTREEVFALDKQNSPHLDEENQKIVAQMFKQALASSEAVRGAVYEHIRGDGTRYVVESNVSIIRDADGKAVGYRGTTRDISARREAEEALRRSEERYRNIIENMEDGYHEIDPAGNSTFKNEALVRIMGYSHEELHGMSYRGYVHPDWQAMIKTVFQEIYRTGAPKRNVVYRIIRKDGAERIIESSISLFRNPAGVAEGFQCLIRDITERQEAEEALRQSEERYRNILASMEDGYQEVDIKGFTTFCNEAMIKILGYPMEEIIGKHYKEFMHPEAATQVREFFGEIYKTGQARRGITYKIIRKDGSERVVETSSSLIRDGKGEVAGFYGVFRDITEREAAQELLRQSEERLRAILSSLDETAIEMDADGTYLNIWTKDESQLSRPKEEMLGRRLEDIYGTEFWLTQRDTIQNVLRTGEAESLEFRNSTGHWFLSRMSPVPASDGAYKSVCILNRNVTERRQAEEDLRENLKKFLEVVSAVSQGDLRHRAQEGEDVLGKAVEAVNTMLDNFSSMLTEVKQIGLSVSSSATEILAASEQIAIGSQRQADEITNTSSAVEEMAASMTQVSRNAEDSAKAARRALEMADNGDRSVRYTADAMKTIESAVLQTAEKMRTLGARSSEISEIINLINEIAAQTNLLALNAAIEAAHAGQAGLGFSVVADEIRKLAERSSRATKDVGNLIKAVQSEISEAVVAMEYGCNKVKDGAKVAEEARSALDEISSAVLQSAELIEEISAASDEQARITQNLAEAMQTISGITLETSAGANETAQTLHGMVELSEQLNRAISQFKVKQDFVHPFSYDTAMPPLAGGGNGRSFNRLSQD